ncbi:DNA replication ATP-dependent helicase/nuclease DNA2, putative [Plasmodium vinckei vinckei]|uniref:DNA replication ATP-dependent helicase/nuclease DNA2, putative n=1 Tax=Plasmodium vinckei vinckei TaxID=54757 RepID=A0A449BS30_PLAVN|nr:DNA replication ATP-dependent helicase/nuclease DNA2, putative [Plasmodium vinckei vinckei]VEV56251.1 DNA replication ATP-dependent helicase/nuclease DNA2, putative [Plasmodium vinckei vinckei]
MGEMNKTKILDYFEKLIKLENIYENKEIELCYEHLNKEELVEKGILLNSLTIKNVTKHYGGNNNSYVLKLVKKKKSVDTNDLSDDENLENFNHNLFSKGSIIHFSKKRKKYKIDNDKNVTVNDNIGIYTCTVNKIKKNKINILINNIDMLCKELNISNPYMLSEKSYFDICLVNSEISTNRQIQAIQLIKNTLENPTDILKILFLDRVPTQSPFLKKILSLFSEHNQEEIEKIEKVEKVEKEDQTNQIDSNSVTTQGSDINMSNYIYRCNKIEWGNKNLNWNQKKAVYHCLYSDNIFCIHGPPGTGKTTVLCEVIFQLIKNRNCKILVTGPSNVSVDNILDKCVSMNIKNVFRIGLKSKIKKTLWNYSYDEKIKECDSYKLCADIDNDIEKLKSEILKLKKKKKNEKSYFDRRSIMNLKYEIKVLNKSKKKKRNIFFKELMEKNNVVFSTCSSSSNYELNKFVKLSNFLFDVVCIDECCQCTEPLCYIPISLAKKNVFLFGDHKQLSPLIKYNKNNNKLNITMFERLISKYKESVSFLLNIQYRMNHNILLWSNKIFYENKLNSHESCKNIKVDDIVGDKKGQLKNGKNEQGEKKKKNQKNKKKGKNFNHTDNKKEDDSSNENNEINSEEVEIKKYKYYPITWIETDGFDEFLDDTKDEDMINFEMKEKKSNQTKSADNNDDTKKGMKKGDTKKEVSNKTDSTKREDNLEVNETKAKTKHGSKSNDINKDNETNEEDRICKLNDAELNDIVKINVDEIINLSNKSRGNIGEAYFIYKLIEYMIKKDKICPNDICVITPYSKQMNILRNIFYDNIFNNKNYINDYKKIEISTVDSFQGREKEIVIFSLVCSNYFKNIGFLKDYRRLNVAITRAKRHIVIVGNSNTISNDDVLNELYETVLDHGKVYLVNELIDVESMIDFCAF